MPGTPASRTPLGYFNVGYDQTDSQPTALTRAKNFYPFVDGIMTYLQGFFLGVTIPGTPIQLLVTTVGLAAGFAAHWNTAGGSFVIFLTPSDDVKNLQVLLVEELSEIFMYTQGQGWFAGSNTEGKIGEGLSLYLGREWALSNSYSARPNVGNQWMTSNRDNTLGAVDPLPDYGPKVAGDLLFLTYLKYQLGFQTNEIISHGDSTSSLASVYKNLTTDTNDPFYPFLSLLNYKFPNKTAIPSGVDQDSPWLQPLINNRKSTINPQSAILNPQ